MESGENSTQADDAECYYDGLDTSMQDEYGSEQRSPLREQDRFLPIANVAKIMKKSVPQTGKIAKEAKECVQECVSEFISFITSEAADRCIEEKRKTVNGEDILFAVHALGFDSYVEPLKRFLLKYREASKLDTSMFDESVLSTGGGNTLMPGQMTTVILSLPPGQNPGEQQIITTIGGQQVILQSASAEQQAMLGVKPEDDVKFSAAGPAPIYLQPGQMILNGVPVTTAEQQVSSSN